MGGGVFLLVVTLLVVVVLVAYLLWAFRGKKGREEEARRAMLQDMAAGTGAWEKPEPPQPTAEAGSPAPAEPGGPQRACPHCGEQFDATLAACPACGRPSEPWFERDGEWYTEAEKGQVFRWDAATGRWVLA